MGGGLGVLALTGLAGLTGGNPSLGSPVHDLRHAGGYVGVLVGHIAAGTQRIRVGSGGIMLPNHAPLVVAEAFGTLEALYPGRIDLGLGRAPGTDQLTMRALRRNRAESEEDFPREVAELLGLVQPEPSQPLADV